MDRGWRLTDREECNVEAWELIKGDIIIWVTIASADMILTVDHWSRQGDPTSVFRTEDLHGTRHERTAGHMARLRIWRLADEICA